MSDLLPQKLNVAEAPATDKVQANLARSAQADTAEAQNITRTPTQDFRKQRKTVKGLEETFI